MVPLCSINATKRSFFTALHLSSNQPFAEFPHDVKDMVITQRDLFHWQILFKSASRFRHDNVITFTKTARGNYRSMSWMQQGPVVASSMSFGFPGYRQQCITLYHSCLYVIVQFAFVWFLIVHCWKIILQGIKLGRYGLTIPKMIFEKTTKYVRSTTYLYVRDYWFFFATYIKA